MKEEVSYLLDDLRNLFNNVEYNPYPVRFSPVAEYILSIDRIIYRIGLSVDGELYTSYRPKEMRAVMDVSLLKDPLRFINSLFVSLATQVPSKTVSPDEFIRDLYTEKNYLQIMVSNEYGKTGVGLLFTDAIVKFSLIHFPSTNFVGDVNERE